MQKASFEARLKDAMIESYAGSLPAVALHALWSAHRASHVYTLARAMPLKDRAKTLAFYAGLDPQSRSDRAIRAAKDAIRFAAEGHAHTHVLAMVPLRDDAVIRAAERLARERKWAGRVLALRLRPEETKLPTSEAEIEDSAFLHSAAAPYLHREGRQEEAREHIRVALNTAKSYDGIVLPILPVLRAMDAFDLLLSGETPLLGDATFFHAAFLAGITASEGALAFVEKLAGDGSSPHRMGVLGAASLGKRDIPSAWQPHLACSAPENVQEYWEEGLISHDELWAANTARHLSHQGLSAGIDASLTAMLGLAHEAASAFSTALLGAWGHELPAKMYSHAERRLEKLVAESLERGRANLFMLARLFRQAADKGHADVAAAGLKTLESKLGEAPTWEDGVQYPSDAELWITILASARGRSLEALPLLKAFPDTDLEARTCLCAGLARDGHKEALQSIWQPTLKSPMSADQVRRILYAAHVMAPDSIAALQETVQETLESLPGTPDSIAAWLSAKDEDEIEL